MNNNIYNTIKSLVRISRPVHWIKNFSIFAAIFLTGQINNNALLTNVIWAYISFCFITSSTYIINDIIDANKDRLHPVKKFRPVASGKLSPKIATVFSLFLSIISFMIAVRLNSIFFLVVISYYVIQIFYSLILKNIPIIDILIIASGFIMRVYAGAFVIDAHLSVWFLLCVISVALFLASGKRRSEINIIENSGNITRASLTKYKRELLNSYVTMFGNAAWLSWAMFTFFESPRATLPVWLVLAEFSKTTTINKILMITIPVVIFGIMRYEHLIFEGKSEMPEKLLLTDKMLISSAIIWVGMVAYVYYGGVANL